MSKRKNRELREQAALDRLHRDPAYISGARCSGIPDDINPALAKARGAA